MNMIPAPGYATDDQLRGMVQSGLPSAVNEEIMRLSMRRGAQVVPQGPSLPGVNQPAKMKPKDMINDFVNRVRAQNEANQNSLVPKGTPMQQGPTPQPQGGPPQRPPQGIAGYASGGVVGFREGGVPRLLDDKQGILAAAPSSTVTVTGKRMTPEEMYQNGRVDDGYMFGPSPLDTKLPSDPGFGPKLQSMMEATKNGDLPVLLGSDRDWRKDMKPNDIPAGQSMVPAGVVDNQAGAGASAMGAAVNGITSGIASTVPSGEKSDSSGASLDQLINGLSTGKYGTPVMGKLQAAPDFVAPEYKDVMQAGRDALNNTENKAEIDAQGKPFEDAAAGLQTDLEENKRASFWNAILKASMVAMQAGGPSSDPASADLFSIAGKSLEGYVASLSEDKKYQRELKREITAYKTSAAQQKFAASNMFRQMAGSAAENENTRSMQGAVTDYNGKLAGMHDANQGIVAAYNGAVNMRGQNMEFDSERLRMQIAAAAKQTGIDPIEFAKAKAAAGEEAAKNAAARYEQGQVDLNAVNAARATAEAKFVMDMLYGPGKNYTSEEVDNFLNVQKLIQRGFASNETLDEATQKKSTGFPAAPTWGSDGIPVPKDTLVGRMFSGSY